MLRSIRPQIRPLWGPVRRYSQQNSSGHKRFYHKKRWIITGGVLLACGGVYATNDTVNTGVKFTVHAIDRTTSVLNAVSKCMWNYYWVINTEWADNVEYNAKLDECHAKCARIARKAIEYNKGLFIKIGQHIAALTYMFPPEWTEEMIPLQDHCPVSSYESVQQLFLADEGRPISEIFAEFEEKPLGTASLAQVHKATLKSGEKVAVKVQHPSLELYIPLDIMLIQDVFRMIGYFFPEYPLTWLSDEIQRSIYTELDFREEARNATTCAENFEPYYQQTALRVPKVHWARPRILCMEFVSGIRPDNLAALDAAGINRYDLSVCFAEIFNRMIFTPNFGLHCDPHAGNIAVRHLSPEEQRAKGAAHNFEVILYDHGLYRYVPTDTRRAYAHLWLSLMSRDDEGMRMWAKEFAHIDDDGFGLFAAAITGRDFENATNNVVSKRSDEERINMMHQIQQQGLIGPVMRMLNQMPPIVLLIFKTNDLIRYIDDKLDALGPVKSFLIMAKYCASAVYHEGVDDIRRKFGHGFGLRSSWAYFTNWCSYAVLWTKVTILFKLSWMIPIIPTDGPLAL